MKTLYIECNMGAAGDMLTAALMELLPDPDTFVAQMNAIGVPDMHMERMEKVSCGLRGTHVSVKIGQHEEISDDVPPHGPQEHHHDHEHGHDHHHHEHDHHHDHEHGHEQCHHHSHSHDHDHHAHEHGHHHHEHPHAGLADVQKIVSRLNLPEKVKKDVCGVYALIAEAEAHAHGTDIAQIHFHEVGMMDAVTDVSAVCLLMHLIAPEKIIVSPITTGFGEVRCMHGIVPVPAPATAFLLQGMPCQSGRIRGELLTPTGAALLKYFADEFGWMPAMTVQKIGCGMGMKEFETANCVRVMLGETAAGTDMVDEISCNLDDMTGEAIGYATERLLEAGALDVYLTAIQMKKNRPGVKLSCICRPADRKRLAELMLRHTSTLGVRMQRFDRMVLERGSETVHTPYGELEIKTASGAGISKSKPEYGSAAKLAKENDVPLAEVIRESMKP